MKTSITHFITVKSFVFFYIYIFGYMMNLLSMIFNHTNVKSARIINHEKANLNQNRVPRVVFRVVI